MTNEPNLSIQTFQEAYESYYGTMPLITIIKGRVRVQNLKKTINKSQLKFYIHYYTIRAENQHTPKCPHNEEEIKFLSDWEQKGETNIHAICNVMAIPITTIYQKMREGLNFQQAFKEYSEIKPVKTYKHNGYEKTCKEWAKYLDMTVANFQTRIRRYGPKDPRTFMLNGELRKAENNPRKPRKNPSHTISGNDEWNALSGKKSTRTVQKTATPKQAANLIAHLIQDSKHNIKYSDSIYYHDSTRFLQNANGHLEWFLEVIPNINVKACLVECDRFITEHQKHI